MIKFHKNPKYTAYWSVHRPFKEGEDEAFGWSPVQKYDTFSDTYDGKTTRWSIDKVICPAFSPVTGQKEGVILRAKEILPSDDEEGPGTGRAQIMRFVMDDDRDIYIDILRNDVLIPRKIKRYE